MICDYCDQPINLGQAATPVELVEAIDNGNDEHIVAVKYGIAYVCRKPCWQEFNEVE